MSLAEPMARMRQDEEKKAPNPAILHIGARSGPRGAGLRAVASRARFFRLCRAMVDGAVTWGFWLERAKGIEPS